MCGRPVPRYAGGMLDPVMAAQRPTWNTGTSTCHCKKVEAVTFRGRRLMGPSRPPLLPPSRYRRIGKVREGIQLTRLKGDNPL